MSHPPKWNLKHDAWFFKEIKDYKMLINFRCLFSFSWIFHQQNISFIKSSKNVENRLHFIVKLMEYCHSTSITVCLELVEKIYWILLVTTLYMKKYAIYATSIYSDVKNSLKLFVSIFSIINKFHISWPKAGMGRPLCMVERHGTGRGWLGGWGGGWQLAGKTFIKLCFVVVKFRWFRNFKCNCIQMYFHVKC